MVILYDSYFTVGLDQTVFISIILGAIGVLFIFLIAVLICLLICYLKCCNKRNNHVPKAILETTSFERRPSVRGSLRKDNSGILQQSPSNLSSLWTFTADTSIPMTVASSSVAISPGPPIPSPVPPPNGPTASLATELNVPHSMSTFPRQNLHVSDIENILFLLYNELVLFMCSVCLSTELLVFF